MATTASENSPGRRLLPAWIARAIFTGKGRSRMVLTGAKLLVLGIFLVSYVLIILLYKHKLIIVAAAVAALLALRVLSPLEALRAVNWNVVLLYFGMLLVGEVFLYSRMPDYLATLFTSRARGTA